MYTFSNTQIFVETLGLRTGEQFSENTVAAKLGGTRMKSTETKEKRIEMVDMHQFFIERIDAAIKEERYIEASWLIYSCMENRFFRVIQKFKNQCKCCKGKCKKSRNELALKTKIDCIKRLCEENVAGISDSFSLDQLENIRKWVKRRNNLMHDLLSLESYREIDIEFKQASIDGQKLLSDLYSSCTNFRKKFYADDYEFVFPEKAMNACPCNQSKGA